mmetsp:Transcript_47513/g.90713  ORF Transcript_47513/g.90713 Transcript_47513/m.90713 type:complete len:243 (+) Transcript_47513:1128-1856(+)
MCNRHAVWHLSVHTQHLTFSVVSIPYAHCFIRAQGRHSIPCWQEPHIVDHTVVVLLEPVALQNSPAPTVPSSISLQVDQRKLTRRSIARHHKLRLRATQGIELEIHHLLVRTLGVGCVLRREPRVHRLPPAVPNLQLTGHAPKCAARTPALHVACPAWLPCDSPPTALRAVRRSPRGAHTHHSSACASLEGAPMSILFNTRVAGGAVHWLTRGGGAGDARPYATIAFLQIHQIVVVFQKRVL